MMNKARLAMIVAAMAVPGAIPGIAGAAAGDERLVSPALSGFVVGHAAASDTESIKEEVPQGETVQAWTRMVTTQRFAGLAAKATPATFAQNVAAGLPRACPGAAISPVTALKVAGRAAVRLQADCPNSMGGRPETFLMLAVAGSADMHVKQVAFRGAKSAADLAWAKRFLARTVLCAPGDKARVCR